MPTNHKIKNKSKNQLTEEYRQPDVSEPVEHAAGLPDLRDIAVDTEETFRDNYKDVPYEDFCTPFVVSDEPVEDRQSSEAIQSLVFATMDNLVAYTKPTPRNQMLEYAEYTEVFTGVPTQVVSIRGTISDVEFDANVDSALDMLKSHGGSMSLSNMKREMADVANRICISCPSIWNPRQNRWEIFEDSHIWLFLMRLVPAATKDIRAYLGDTIIISGTIAKYEKNKNGHVQEKWGIREWIVIDAFQEYLSTEGRVMNTPDSVERIAPVLSIDFSDDTSGEFEVWTPDKEMFEEEKKKLRKAVRRERSKWYYIDQSKYTDNQS